ncbi:hypothetical protein GGR50DRAFT_702043, partial [Xylaria sp. CBS 124048]
LRCHSYIATLSQLQLPCHGLVRVSFPLTGNLSSTISRSILLLRRCSLRQRIWLVETNTTVYFLTVKDGLNYLVTPAQLCHNFVTLSQPCNFTMAVQSHHGFATLQPRYSFTTAILQPRHDSAVSPRFCNVSPRSQWTRHSLVARLATSPRPCDLGHGLATCRHGLRGLVTASSQGSQPGPRPCNLGHGFATCRQALVARHGLATSPRLCNLATALQRVATVSVDSSQPRRKARNPGHGLATSATALQRVARPYPATLPRPRNLALCNVATVLQLQPRPHHVATTSITSSQPRHFATILQPRYDSVASPRFCNFATVLQRVATALIDSSQSTVSLQFRNLGYNFATLPWLFGTRPQLQLLPCNLAT